MKPKVCQKCGRDDRVRKVTRENLHWCKKCREEREPKPKKMYVTAEAARKAFARQRHRKPAVNLDFDALHAEFSNDCKTFREIAEDQGLTRERIRQLYNKYFSRIIPRRPDGRARRRVCTLKRRALNKTVRLERLFNNPAAFALKSAVESFGLGINIIRLNPTSLSIGGKQCAFYFCNKARQNQPRSKKLYWRFNLSLQSLKKSEFVVLLLIESEEFRFFIVPTHKLPVRNLEVRKNLYVPQGGADPKGRGRRNDSFDVLKCENAWHYLDEKKSPESQAVNPSISPA